MGDMRDAVRSLRHTPVVTAVVVLSLALGIGANTAIFSLLNGLILRPLPVRDPASLVHVTDSVLRDNGDIRVRAWSYPVWRAIAERSELFESATAWAFTRFDASNTAEAQLVDGIWADGAFFDALGVRAALGRTFSVRDDDRGGGPDGPVTVISHSCWERQFGADPKVIGRTAQLNHVRFTIVGVTEPDFSGPEVGRTFDFAVPLKTEALLRGRDSVLESSSSNFLSILARLRPGQSLATVTAQLQSIQPAIRQATLEPMDPTTAEQFLTSPFRLLPAAAGYSNLRSTYSRSLVVLAVIVALVLLIGCVNVANLLLARSIARQQELSVRLALGASRRRLVRQMLVESLVLAVAGAALGVIVASYTSAFLVAQLSTPVTRVFLDVSIDRSVLGFAVAAALVTALTFGAVPALRASGMHPIDALKQMRSSTERSGHRVMGWLLSAQVALAVVMVVAAGLFLGSFTWLANRDLGLESAQVMVVTIDPLRTNTPPDQRVALYDRVREAVAAMPGVAHAAISHVTPVGGGGFTPALSLGQAEPIPANGDVFGNLISPGWFDTFGTPMIAGRDFRAGDRRGAPRVAIVNAAFVRRYIPDGRALGLPLTIYPNTLRAMTAEIVGVAGNAIYASPREAVPPTWYVPMAQFDVPGFPFAAGRLSVRTAAGSPALVTQAIAAAAATVHPALSLTFRPLAEQIRASLVRERLMAQLAGFLGVLALLLAAIGLYGVTSYAVVRRRPEIAIRMALGAKPRAVIGLILRRVVPMVAVGLCAGAAISLWASQFVGGLIYGLEPQDPTALFGGATLLGSLAVITGWLAARRAAQIDPIVALRDS